MVLINILKKKNIIKRNIYYADFFEKLKNQFIKKPGLDQEILKYIGKGKWLFSSFFIEKNKLKIFSLCSNNLFLNWLNNFSDKEKFLMDLHLDFQFWDELNKITKEKKLIITDLKTILGVKAEIYSDDKEMNTFKIKSKASLNKNTLFKFLKSIFIKFYSQKPYIIIDLKNKSADLKIRLEDNDLEINGNFNQNIMLRFLNSIFLSKCKNMPSYCIWYADIKKIDGGWKTGKRRGYLVQEYGNEKKNWIKKYEF